MANARTTYRDGQGVTAAHQAWNRPANGGASGQPRRCAWACARSRCVAGRPFACWGMPSWLYRPLLSFQYLGVLAMPLVVGAGALALRRWRLAAALVLVPLKLALERVVKRYSPPALPLGRAW